MRRWLLKKFKRPRSKVTGASKDTRNEARHRHKKMGWITTYKMSTRSKGYQSTLEIKKEMATHVYLRGVYTIRQARGTRHSSYH